MTKSSLAQRKFVVGSSRGSRNGHSLRLQMAREAEELARQGARIAALREPLRRDDGSKVTQPDVAEAVGVSLRAYQIWEAGAGDLDPKHRKALAAYFNVPESYIEHGGDDETPDMLGHLNSVSQLDRIESKLNQILELLTPADAETAAVVAELGDLPDRVSQAAGSRSSPKQPRSAKRAAS